MYNTPPDPFRPAAVPQPAQSTQWIAANPLGRNCQKLILIITLLMVLFEAGLGSIAAAILFEKSSHRPIHYR
jgi:hypothetical protein